jgi:O-antigen ligase
MTKDIPINERLVEMFEKIPYEEPITSPRKKDDEIAEKSELESAEANVDVQESASGESEAGTFDSGAIEDNDVVIPLPTVASPTDQPVSRLATILKFAVVVYLVGMVILSVEQFLVLPSNLASVDFWNFLFLPICVLYLVHTRQAVRFPYALGIWFIFLGSFIGTFSATNPMASIFFMIKEVYLYVLFVTLVAVFASLESGLMRRILLVWLTVAVLHGVLLVAEFVLPDFYAFMISFLGRIGFVDPRYIGRPAGLWDDPVWAALFQLMGFVPLLLVGLRRELTLFLGMVLLLSILATASLGALTSLAGASVVAVFVLLLMGGHLKSLAWLATILILAAGLFVITISQFPDVLASLEHLTTDRAAHTTGERLHLWEGGTAVLFSQKAILGVGPDNYRDFLENKTLHNDTLEFGVERGVIGLLGLALLGGEALNSSVKILLKQIKSGDTALPSGVFFLAMLVGIYLESNAHQIFHFRSVWLGLVMLEATHSRMLFSGAAFERQTGLKNKLFQTPEKSSPKMGRRDSSAAEAG